MRKFLLSGIVLAGALSLFTTEASAIVCAKGVHGAACVGPGGAVAGRRYYGGTVIRRPGTAVRHFNGPYRSRTTIRRY